MTPLIWYGISLLMTFILGFLIGTKSGKKQALQEQLLTLRKMEATKLWTENIGRYVGGQNGKR